MRNLVIICCFLALAACGFEPLYGSHNNAGAPSPLSGIVVEPVKGAPGSQAMGQQLKNTLEDLFDPQGAAREKPYRLIVALTSTETPVIVLPDGSIARYNITLVADYQLVPAGAGAGAPLTQGRVKRIGSYNVSTANEKFSTFTSKQDTLKRDLDEIAEGIRLQLASFLRGAGAAAR